MRDASALLTLAMRLAARRADRRGLVDHGWARLNGPGAPPEPPAPPDPVPAMHYVLDVNVVLQPWPHARGHVACEDARRLGLALSLAMQVAASQVSSGPLPLLPPSPLPLFPSSPFFPSSPLPHLPHPTPSSPLPIFPSSLFPLFPIGSSSTSAPFRLPSRPIPAPHGFILPCGCLRKLPEHVRALSVVAGLPRLATGSGRAGAGAGCQRLSSRFRARSYRGLPGAVAGRVPAPDAGGEIGRRRRMPGAGCRGRDHAVIPFMSSFHVFHHPIISFTRFVACIAFLSFRSFRSFLAFLSFLS